MLLKQKCKEGGREGGIKEVNAIKTTSEVGPI